MVIRPLLTAESSIIDIVTTATGCVIPDTASIVLTPNQCAGTLRAVKIGASASFSVDVSPNPASEQVNVAWSSGAIGEHTIQIISAVGEIIAERTFVRSVASPTSGAESFDLYPCANGAYLIVLNSTHAVLSTRLLKTE